MSLEHIALCLMVAAIFAAALLAGPPDEGRALGSAIARRMACAPRAEAPCHPDPLVEAYGRPLARLARALSPGPIERGGLVPVDFRRCRRPSCARPSGDPRLTVAGRRVTAFTELKDRRRSGGGVSLTYWAYRPGLGWAGQRRDAAGVEPAAGVPLRGEPIMRLLPLETLPGRDHHRFGAGEEPPWRWRVLDG